MKVTALESNTQFRIQIGRAAEDARLRGVPLNTLNPDHVVELDGQPYSLEWFHTDFNNMASTLIFTVTITCRATGQRVQYRVIQARRRTGAHWNCKHIGMNVRTLDDANRALTEAAAAFLASRARTVVAA